MRRRLMQTSPVSPSAPAVPLPVPSPSGASAPIACATRTGVHDRMLPLVPASASACVTVTGLGSDHVLSPRRYREIEGVPVPIRAAAIKPPVVRTMAAPLTVPTLRVAAVPSPSCPRAPSAVPEFVPPREIGAKPDGEARRAQGETRGSTTETHELATRTFNPASTVPDVSHQKSPLDAPVRGRGANGDAAPSCATCRQCRNRLSDTQRRPRAVSERGPGFGFRLCDNRVVNRSPRLVAAQTFGIVRRTSCESSYGDIAVVSKNNDIAGSSPRRFAAPPFRALNLTVHPGHRSRRFHRGQSERVRSGCSPAPTRQCGDLCQHCSSLHLSAQAPRWPV